MAVSVSLSRFAGDLEMANRAHKTIQQYVASARRFGISNSRLQASTRDLVTFGTKHGRNATLHPVEFLRRLVQHVLPPGFHTLAREHLLSTV